MEESKIHIEYVDYEEVQRWPRNPKDHDLQEIKKSFTRFGFVNPIILDEGTGSIVAGHGRLDALKLMKTGNFNPPKRVVVEDGKWLVPILRGITFDDPSEAEAYVLADNKLSEIGGWKSDVLSEVLKDMVDVDGALEGTGFTIDDVMPEQKTQEELESKREKRITAEECLEIWKVESGDIWQINKHFIMCGSSANRADIDLLFSGEKVTGIITSPPYAMQRKSTYGGVHEDDYVEWFYDLQKIFKSLIVNTGHFLLNIKPHTGVSGKYQNQLHPYVKELTLKMQTEWGWCLIDEYCWPRSTPPRRVVKKFRNGWEPIYWFTKNREFKWYPDEVKGTTDTAVIAREKSWGKWSDLVGKQTYFIPQGQPGKSYPSNVVYFGLNSDNRHPAQFTETMPEFFITACSVKDEKWFDPFCGCGTVLFAAETVGRIGYGMEIDPKYVALILDKANERNMSILKVRQGESNG